MTKENKCILKGPCNYIIWFHEIKLEVMETGLIQFLGETQWIELRYLMLLIQNNKRKLYNKTPKLVN